MRRHSLRNNFVGLMGGLIAAMLVIATGPIEATAQKTIENTTRPAGSLTVLDGTTAGVSSRAKMRIWYSPRGVAIDAVKLVEWAKLSPKGGYILLDFEPIPSLADAIRATKAITAARPDLRVSWYGLVDMNQYGSDGVRGAYAALAKPEAQRTDSDLWYIGNVGTFLRWQQDSRADNDTRRELAALCSYIEIRLYPENTKEQANTDWITCELDALSDEAHRLGRGKPVVLLVSGRLGFEVTWPAPLISYVRDRSIVNAIDVVTVWDSGASAKQVDGIAAEMAKRDPSNTKGN